MGLLIVAAAQKWLQFYLQTKRDYFHLQCILESCIFSRSFIQVDNLEPVTWIRETRRSRQRVPAHTQFDRDQIIEATCRLSLRRSSSSANDKEIISKSTSKASTKRSRPVLLSLGFEVGRETFRHAHRSVSNRLWCF
jgi:hypothetical protein